MRLSPRLLCVAFGGALLAALPVHAQTPDSTARATADSTYSEEQAGRGEQVFTRVCIECHARTEMASADFRLKWGGQTTFDLFKSITTTMPDSDPGSLPLDNYTDVVAYILKLNGIPAGAAALTADSASMSRAKLVLPPQAALRTGTGGHRLLAVQLTARRSPWQGHRAR